MNFKSWLLISEEEEKDINLSNPNLTIAIPPLNTSVSNPNLTINIPPLNTNQERDRKNIRSFTTGSDRFKELAIYYGRNKSAPSTFESIPENKSLGVWLNGKKIRTPNPHEKSDKTWAEIVSEFPKWIDPDTKQPFKYPNLPINWRDVKPNVQQEEGRIKSSKRLEKLAYYYGRNGSAPSASDFNKENKSLGVWLEGKKRTNPNPYEESDKETWNRMVELSKTWDKKKFPHDLPNDWRIIEPAGEKSLGEKLVLNILTELGIKNDPQHRDEACFNQRCLPFDFSITHNGKKYLLEYHGGQHYYPVYFGSGEEKTKQIIAKHAIDKFEYTKENDTKKYEHCVKENIPFLVIPYWLYKNPDIIKSKIIEFLNTNQFNETFANPVVPPKYKEYHDRKLKMTECFASGKIPNCKDLFKKQKTTFEQFLINKNFINI